MKIKASKIVTVKSYIDTLRSFSSGETRHYILVDTDYTGFHNARKRLKDGLLWEFEMKSLVVNCKKYFEIKRIK